MHARVFRMHNACTRQHIASYTTSRVVVRTRPPRVWPLPWPPAADTVVVLAPTTATRNSSSGASSSAKPGPASSTTTSSSTTSSGANSAGGAAASPASSAGAAEKPAAAAEGAVTRAALKRIHELHCAPPALERLRVRGDGACMFRSLAQGDALLGTGTLLRDEPAEWAAAAALRARIVDRLRDTRDDIEPFIPGIVEGSETFEAYLDRMARPSTWGGEPELAAASQVLQRPVAVYSPSSMMGPPQHIITYGAELPSPPVHVLWSGAHYDLLVPRGVRSRL